MDPRFALVLACFFLSGFAALLYQTAWTRELSFVFGTSELAVAAVLAAYMGGLALGAAAAARYALRLRRPVLIYGVLELAIAVSALLVPSGIRGINAIYVAALGGGSELPEIHTTAALLQLASAFLVLLPPTAFMGATLPLLARHAVHSDEEIAPQVGALYAVNTAGAIGGTLCAAFWLMPELGLRQTVWVGAGLNALVFLLAAQLAQRLPAQIGAPAGRDAARTKGRLHWILPSIAVSGAISFSYEVMWTRLLGQLFGATVQAFSIMLASFLLGIALGSAAASRLARTRTRAALGFALAQLGIALTAYGAFATTNALPILAQQLGAGPDAPWPSALVSIVVLLPLTLCIGATFPFAVRVLARDVEDAARATARVYAWNTLGAIVGAIATGFVLLPELRFEGTLALGVVGNLALAACAALAGSTRGRWLAALAAAAAALLILVPPTPPWTLLSWAPMEGHAMGGERVHFAVGRTSSVMLIESEGRFRLASDGLPEAWIRSRGMQPKISVAHWLGALPAMVRPEARSLLVVGLGGATALELLPSSYESIDVIELEPRVLEANHAVADRRDRNPLSDPRVRVYIGDARGTLQLADNRYDAIVSQPSHPWTAGASHLYTREFFELVGTRLTEEGVFVQWIGIHFVDEDLLRSLLAALVEAFPHVELFRPEVHGFLFVASRSPIDSLRGAERALEIAPDEMTRFGLDRLEDFASAWALDEESVRALAKDAAPNTDDDNRLADRSSRLGDSRLDSTTSARLLDPLDPLLRTSGLDLSALARSLTARRQPERALDVAMSGNPAEEEAALGWIEHAAGRTARAGRHFRRALELSPGDPNALSGLVACHRGALSAGHAVPGLDSDDFDPGLAALAQGWQRAEAREWVEVAALDDDLSSIVPGQPLFRSAARLRAAQRLTTERPQAAAEAQLLAEQILQRSWSPSDELLRARAAIAAGNVIAARGSLYRVIINSLNLTPHGRDIAAQVEAVARLLPDDHKISLRNDIVRRMDRQPAANAAGSAMPASQEPR